MTRPGTSSNGEEVTVCCGKCGSANVHFDPCPECEYAQAGICFDCGTVNRLSGEHEEGCPRG